VHPDPGNPAAAPAHARRGVDRGGAGHRRPRAALAQRRVGGSGRVAHAGLGGAVRAAHRAAGTVVAPRRGVRTVGGADGRHRPGLPPRHAAARRSGGAAGSLAVLYMALIAGAGAMALQTWAQAHMPATRAAIVMTTEPVFAAAFAVAFGSDLLTWRMLAGGALVLGAMYLVELAPRRTAALGAEAVHHEV